MKKLTCIVAGLLLVSLAGTTQAARYIDSEDCTTDGPRYNRDHEQGPDNPTIVVEDQGPLYIEGMGFAPQPKGPKTIVPIISESCDLCGEGYTLDELERYFKNTNEIRLAAGK